MNRTAAIQELLKLARELTGREDSPEDIATDVVTRMSGGITNHAEMIKIFKEIGHADLLRSTRTTDLPHDFESLDKSERIKAMTKAIEKALGRQKVGSQLAPEILKIAKELTAIEFPTQEAMRQYLLDHPNADRGNHRVVPSKLHPKHLDNLAKEIESTKRRALKTTDKEEKEMYEQDAEILAEIHSLSKSGKFKEAYRLGNILDSAVRDQIPTALWNHLATQAGAS